MTTGLLLQPFCTVIWAGNNLSAFEMEDGSLECLANKVKVKLQKAEAAPTCSFEITPSPAGFELFTKLKEESLTEPFQITLGYPGSDNKVTWAFRYAGMSLTTGQDPAW